MGFLTTALLEKIEKTSGIHGENQFGLDGVGKNVSGILGRYTQVQKLSVCLKRVLGRPPENFGCLSIGRYCRRNHIRQLIELRILDIPLTFLGIRRYPMPDQLMRQSPGNPIHAEGKRDMLERGKMIPPAKQAQKPINFFFTKFLVDLGGRQNGIATPGSQGHQSIRLGCVL